MTWPRAIAHCDLDQFYAAVEILDFPELKGKPVIVGGLPGSRGVVCTASYEARQFGVHSAMASSQAAKLCPQGIWRKPRMERYVEKSREVRAVFEGYTDQIEPLSLDEAFLDLTGSLKLFGPPEKIGLLIKDEVFAKTSLVVSVGVAVNKFLAKLASDLKKPNGFVVVPPEPDLVIKFLEPLPVSRLWGAGPKTCEHLKKYGLHTIGDIARSDPAFLTRRLGQQLADHLLSLSKGLDNREVETGDRPRSISHEDTFAEDLFNRAAMERELLACADEVAARLRAKNLRCQGVTLKVRMADLTRLTRSLLLEDPTDLTGPLHSAAVQMLRTRLDLQGQGVRLLGIAATHLLAPGEATESLFPDEGATRARRAAQAIDRLRERFGDDAVTFGRLLEGRQRNTGTPDDSRRLTEE
ncbi:MAG TPA: DNA polymerase IV [Planctomycetota bacterium]